MKKIKFVLLTAMVVFVVGSLIGCGEEMKDDTGSSPDSDNGIVQMTNSTNHTNEAATDMKEMATDVKDDLKGMATDAKEKLSNAATKAEEMFTDTATKVQN